MNSAVKLIIGIIVIAIILLLAIVTGTKSTNSSEIKTTPKTEKIAQANKNMITIL
ncbi:hypothetical protein [Companilactobacillus halodurans]|uniref:hypothetical protein n=1 Tax=Companilactobacillus halodurans TaxID=2584183 RepID=UPI001296CE1D|nr:hypothetical protein [Companilactobacillus halodurans]